MHEDPSRSSRLVARSGSLFQADLFLGEWSGVEGFVKQLTIWKIRPHLCRDPAAVDLLLEDLKGAAALSVSSVTHILDVWQSEQDISVATEHVGGIDLAEAARRAAGRGELLPLDMVLSTVLESAQALELAHDPQTSGGRVAHGDLRPEVVLLGFEGTVRVTGFGFGRFLPAVSPDGAWCGWGGRCYQPWERLAPGPVDPRSDVFALGAILLEAVSGHLPFGTDDPEELVRRVRSAESVLPAKASGMPEDVGRVVSRACATRLEDRYQTVGEMAADLHGILFERRRTGTSRAKVRELVERLAAPLEELEESTSEHQSAVVGASELLAPMSAPRPASMPRGEPERGKLIGRLEPLRAVSRAMAGTRRGSGQAILVLGEPGMGRTRLLAEVAVRLTAAGRRLAWLGVRARREERNLPLSAALRLIASAVGLEPSADLGRLARSADRLRAFGLDRQTIDTVSAMVGEGEPPDPARAAGLIGQAVVKCVSGLSFEQATIVAWDDVQWADEASASCLGELLDQLDFMPVVALLTARIGYEPPWPAPRLSKVVLPPLARDECEDLALDRLKDASRVDPSLLDALVERSRGVPALLLETLELAIEAGRIEVEGYYAKLKGGPDAPLPELEDAVQARLETLDSDALTVATAAALAAPALRPSIIAAATGLELKATRRALDWLTDQQGLLVRTDGGYAFASDRLRETALAAADPGAVAALRGPTARAILAESGEPGDGLDDLAATLLAEGGSKAAAAEVLYEAAKGHEAKGDLAGAAERHARALELARESGSITIDFELKLCLSAGRAALHTLDLDLAEATLRDAVELADRTQEPKTSAEARILLLKLLTRQMKFEGAIELAKEAIPYAEASGDSLTLARAYGALGETYQAWGHYGPDLRYVEAAIRFASDTGDLLQLGHFLQLAAMHAAGVGETEQTEALLDRARPIAKASSNPLLTCQLLKAESLLKTFQRDYAGALEVSLKTVELAHGHGLLELEIIMLHNAGDAHLRLGNAREALYFFNESARRSKAARYDRLTQTNEIYIGYIEAAHLGAVEGLDRLRDAIEVARRRGRIWNLQEGNQLVGRILLAWGDRSGAVPYFEEAARHAETSGIRFFIEEASYWLEQARGVEPVAE